MSKKTEKHINIDVEFGEGEGKVLLEDFKKNKTKKIVKKKNLD